MYFIVNLKLLTKVINSAFVGDRTAYFTEMFVRTGLHGVTSQRNEILIFTNEIN